MELERIELHDLIDEGTLKIAIEEALRYGKHRGSASACGDKYGMMGGPKFDDVLIGYLNEKFGVPRHIREISKAIPKIPEELINTLERGFSEGYSECVRKMREEDDDY